MANFGPLAAEIGSGVWGTPANFNGFRVLAALPQRRRSQEANQSLHDVWPSPALVHYIYILRGSCALKEFRNVQNSLKVQVLSYPILAALLHGTPAAGVSQSLRRGTRNRITELSQRSPPIFGWAAITLGLAHILVFWHTVYSWLILNCVVTEFCTHKIRVFSLEFPNLADIGATVCKTVRPMLSDHCLSVLFCLTVCLSCL